MNEYDPVRSLMSGFARSREHITSPEALAAHPAGCKCLHHKLAERTRDITDKIRRGEIAHGLPPGYSFDFTPIDYRVAGRLDLTAQVRGTAPEPPPDGFLVPPGLAEDLRKSIAELFGIPGEMLEPGPPPTRRQRIRNKVSGWREQAARRAFKLIAGYWPDGREDDWWA